MVSYYNPGNMYRHHQQAAAGPTPVHSWYANYHPQSQMGADQQLWEPQMWHHHHHVPPPPHSVFNGAAAATDFNEFVHAAAGGVEHQLMPSPTVTVSAGSDMSSPGGGGGGGGMSPPTATHQQQVARPPPARSPYEWIKKTSYQSQPNPERENYENSPHNVLLSDTSSHQEPIGKTRTKDKYRVVYTDHQRVELEKEFYYSRYITIRRKAELANNLGLSERQVKIWFQNRRAKERKQVKKREEFTQKDNTTIPMGHMTHQPIINSNNNQIGQNMMSTQMM